MRICHGSVPLIVLVLILSVSPFVAAQSSYAVLKAAAGPGAEVAREYLSKDVTPHMCTGKDCVSVVTTWFTTTNPDLDGKTLVPVPLISNPKVISVDTSLQPTAVWNGAPAKWKVTGLEAGTSTLRAQDPATGTTSNAIYYTVMEVRRVIGKYLLTDPKDKGVSGSKDRDVRSFWVVRKGRYVNEVKVKALFTPIALETPRCFYWTVKPPGGVIIQNAKAPNTKLIIKQPGSYWVRAHCGPNYKQIRLHAIYVEEVRWEPFKNPLTPNPGTGLPNDLAVGLRIFPGKRTYRAKANAARKVKVVARVHPPITGIDLYFRGWDVDDPSWNRGVVDGDTKGNDNRGTPKKGSPRTAVRTTTGPLAEATLTVRLPRQPGDNLVYSVATTSESDKGIAFDDSIYVKDGKGKRVEEDSPTKVAGVTPLLTIWRKLHYEMDHMSDVRHNYRGARITKVSDLGRSWGVDLNRSVADPRGSANRFENGRMQERGPGGRIYRIYLNTPKMVVILHAPGAGDANRPRVGRVVRLYDDDIQKAGVASPDPEWLAKLLRHCYIVPRGDQGGGTAPFALNYDAPNKTPDEITPYYKFDTQKRNEDAFWVVYLLGAYQYDYPKDADPDDENSASVTMGVSDSLRGLGASVFTETIYDVHAHSAEARRQWRLHIKYTTAHETMHLLGDDHGGKFMGGYSHRNENLSAKSIKVIRETVKP